MPRLRKIALLLAVILIVGTSLIALSFQHWWLKNLASAVFLNEEYSDQATVFRNSNGDFLICTNEEANTETYVYFSSIKQIGVPNGDQFIFLGVLVYNKDLPVPTVLSSDRIKIEQDMNVVEQNEWFEFTGLSGRRIKVYRSNL